MVLEFLAVCTQDLWFLASEICWTSSVVCGLCNRLGAIPCWGMLWCRSSGCSCSASWGFSPGGENPGKRLWTADPLHSKCPWTCGATKCKTLDLPLFRIPSQKHQLELSFCYLVFAPRWNCFKDLDIWASAMGMWGRARKETTSGRAAAVEGPGLGVGSLTARVYPEWLWKARSHHSVCIYFTPWSK